MLQLSPQDKKEIFDLLSKVYIRGLKDFDIPNSNRKVLSFTILNGINKKTEWEKVLYFLNSLSTDYPLFKGVSLEVKGLMYRKQESEILNRLRQQIKGL